MRRVVVLGSTGSIGTQTLDVVRAHPDQFRVVGLAARSNAALLEAQAQEFGVRGVLTDRDGMDAAVDLATTPDADVVVVSVAGVIGLLPTLAAIDAGKQIALASKEVLVAAGEIVMPRLRAAGGLMTPIDSEHSALFQCLQGADPTHVDRLILTVSGGPFRGKSRDFLEGVTQRDALNHPTWNMGGKITIDSATLMNKGLETLEARWLFDVPLDRIDTVVHPQSIVHSFVKFRDGSVLGQLGWPNMRLPILLALSWPDRLPNDLKPWNPADTPTLAFEPVDHATFPCLQLAIEAGRQGGTVPCAMNAANEEAANAFLREEIRFLDIPRVVERTMGGLPRREATLDNLLATDAEARAFAREEMAALA